MSHTIEEIMCLAPVIPVLVIEDASHARPIAEALVAGGLKVLEVTMRTSAALDVMREMKQVPGAVVGAGTVLNPHQFEAAMHAGAEFIVSPGLTENLARVVISHQVPFLPGVATAGEVMHGLDLGLGHFKFFPATAAGGIPALKAIAAPFGGVKFCPTGGVSQATAPDWLALDPVLCVGGSWVVPKGPPDCAAIEAAARAASDLA